MQLLLSRIPSLSFILSHSFILSLSVSLLLCVLHVKSTQIWLCGSDCHSLNELLCQARGFGSICLPSASLAPHHSALVAGLLSRVCCGRRFFGFPQHSLFFYACGIRLSRRRRFACLFEDERTRMQQIPVSI